MNYNAILPAITRNNAWFTGIGVRERGTLDFIGTTVFDGFYLKVLFWSGIPGFIILAGTFYWFTTLYFTDVKYMTKLQKLTAGLLVITLYYGFFESFMFGNDGMILENWILFILCMYEKTSSPLKTEKYIA